MSPLRINEHHFFLYWAELEVDRSSDIKRLCRTDHRLIIKWFNINQPKYLWCPCHLELKKTLVKSLGMSSNNWCPTNQTGSYQSNQSMKIRTQSYTLLIWVTIPLLLLFWTPIFSYIDLGVGGFAFLFLWIASLRPLAHRSN